MNNIGQFLIQFLGIAILKIVVFFVAKFTTPKIIKLKSGEQQMENMNIRDVGETTPSKGANCTRIIGLVFGYIDKKMNWELYWAIFCSLQVDLFLGSWATLKVSKKVNLNTMICNLLIAVLVAHYLVYISIVIWNIVKIGKGKEQPKSNIFSIVNQNSRSSYGILILVTTKDMFLPFILIFAASYPGIQIGSVAISFILILLYTGIFWPFKDRVDNWLGCFNSISYFVVMVFFGVLYIFDGSLSEENKYQIFGHLIIGILAATVLTNLIVGALLTIYGAIQYYKTYKKKNTKIV